MISLLLPHPSFRFRLAFTTQMPPNNFLITRNQKIFSHLHLLFSIENVLNKEADKSN